MDTDYHAGGDTCDAIVVGANICGLTTAYLLGQLGYHTRLLERAPFVGGKDASFTNRNGKVFDYGLHLLDDMRSEITSRLFRHMVDGQVISSQKRRGIVVRNHVIPYNTPVTDWPESLRSLFPEPPLKDHFKAGRPTRTDLSPCYGEAFTKLAYDEILASYPSEQHHRENGVDESRLMSIIYPWYFPRAERPLAEDVAAVVSTDQESFRARSRAFQDRLRASGQEPYLYPTQGGFGSFANGFRKKCEAQGVEVIVDIPDLDFEVNQDFCSIEAVTAHGRRLQAPRIFWCGPWDVLCRLMGISVPEVKPDRYLLGSFEFEQPLLTDCTEMIVGDPNHLINRINFPGNISANGDNTLQLEFCFPKDSESCLDEAVWRERWLTSLRALGLVAEDNSVLDFDLKTFPILYNVFGLEEDPFNGLDPGHLHPQSNVHPVNPTVNNRNINSRLPGYLEYVLAELSKPI